MPLNQPDNLQQSLQRTASYIRSIQEPDGGIPWFAGSIVDPWDHVEAAMGLAVGGHHAAAAAAYDWLVRLQRADGSWLAAYRNGAPADATRAETNFVAYVATGVWHQFLCTADTEFLRRLWPTVAAAMEFVLDLQTPHGDIHWAIDSRKGIDRDALLTGCSSIYASLGCALQIAATLGEDGTRLRSGRAALGEAIRDKPHRFDRTWESKARYAMDWFYPVLTGAISGSNATARLEARWQEFVEDGLGCRCVADEPWVTIAETCELVMALCVNGQQRRAAELFAWLQRFQADDGSWWTGYVSRDESLWPDERPTWTAGAVLLAADTLYGITPGQMLFLASRTNDS